MSCFVRVGNVLLHSKMKEHTQIMGGEGGAFPPDFPDKE
jgi:hypothetical protein